MREDINKVDINVSILNDIENTPLFQNHWEYQSRSYITILCYFLWKLLNNLKINTVDDLAQEINIWHPPVDDLIHDFAEEKEYWNGFKKLRSRYTAEEISKCIISSRHFDKDYFESIPEGLGILLDKLLFIEPGDTVFELNCKEAEYLISSSNRNREVTYLGLDDEYMAITMAEIVTEVSGISNLKLADTTINFEDDLELVNKVIANTNIDPDMKYHYDEIGTELEERWPEFPMEASAQWNTCALAASMIKDKGRAVSIINGGQLKMDIYKDARKAMCEAGFVEGVIALPEKIYETTWISPYILIMGSGSRTVRFLDASRDCTAGRYKGKKINVLNEEAINSIIDKYHTATETCDVSVEEIAENDYNLSPARYLNRHDDDIDTVELGSFIEGNIRRGMTLSGTDMDKLLSGSSEGYRCILPSDILNGVVLSKLSYKGDLKISNKNRVSAGDIIISKTGKPFRVAVADGDYLCIGSVFMMTIDKNKISPAYIKCFLSSKRGQDELSRFDTGSLTTNITVASIPKIRIPVYDKDTQDKLNRKAEQLVKDLESHYRGIDKTLQTIDQLFD